MEEGKNLESIRVLKDEDCEMMEIYQGDKCLFMGNYWDLGREQLFEILKELGFKVEHSKYKYEE